MFIKHTRQLLTLFFLTSQCSSGESEPSPVNSFTIAFGSCANQGHPLPIFDEVVKHQPDVFLFLGDNIYGDTMDMDVLRNKYQRLGSKPSYQNFKSTPTFSRSGTTTITGKMTLASITRIRKRPRRYF